VISEVDTVFIDGQVMIIVQYQITKHMKEVGITENSMVKVKLLWRMAKADLVSGM
jgi:hypothetical protein